jgi:FimV-like protein
MLHLNTPTSSLRGIVVALSVLMTSQIHALQLGQPTLQSQLGQPLKLEVQISDLNAQEAQDFQAVLADDTVYQTAKINRVAGLDNVTLNLSKRSDDVYVLQMLGTEPLVSPYVDILLEFRWATGRAFRNIGFPLNGTLANTAKGLVAADPPPAPAAKQATRPTPLPKAADTPKEPAVAATPQVKEPAANSALPQAGKSIEVKRGDTASGLILATDTDDVSLDQLLVTMLRNNPKAFVNNNVNRLKAGALVTLPTPEEAAQVNRQEARQSIRLQAQDFDAYRAQLASAAPATALANADQREASGGVKAQVKNNGATASDQLTLSKPGATDADKVSKQLEDEQTAKRNEELAKNTTELGAISEAASKMEEGQGPDLSNFEAQYEAAMVWIKRHAFELIGALALLAAALVTFSLLRERRLTAREREADDASELDFMQEPSHQNADDLNLDFDLDLPEQQAQPVGTPSAPAAAATAPAHHSNAAPFQVIQPTSTAHRAPHMAMHDNSPMGEDPFKVRLELADELWKLGQKQTGRALAQEVADQTHGETRDRAMRWLTERA